MHGENEMEMGHEHQDQTEPTEQPGGETQEGGLGIFGDLNNELAFLDIGKEGLYSRTSAMVRRLENGEAEHPEITVENLETEVQLVQAETPDQEEAKKRALKLIDDLREQIRAKKE